MSILVNEIKIGMRIVDESLFYSRTFVDNDGFTTSNEMVRYGAVEFLDATSTTDDTVTTISTIEMPVSSTLLVAARVLARRTGGSAGAANDALAYEIKATFKNVAGAATQVGTTTIIMSDKDQIGWDVVFDVSGGNVLIDVNGAIDNNVDWVCMYTKHLLTTTIPLP